MDFSYDIYVHSDRGARRDAYKGLTQAPAETNERGPSGYEKLIAPFSAANEYIKYRGAIHLK
jgi:hypothetical protein